MPYFGDFGFRADTGSTRITAGMEATTLPKLLTASTQARASMAGVVKNYGEFIRYIEGVTPDIILLAMRTPFELSQKYVPVKTGRLKASGYLIITRRGKVPQVEIGYGRNNDPDYAGIQHEDMEFRHTAPTRAKYLQVALEESQTVVWHDIQELLRLAVEGGINLSSVRAKQIVPSGVRVR